MRPSKPVDAAPLFDVDENEAMDRRPADGRDDCTGGGRCAGRWEWTVTNAIGTRRPPQCRVGR